MLGQQMDFKTNYITHLMLILCLLEFVTSAPNLGRYRSLLQQFDDFINPTEQFFQQISPTDTSASSQIDFNFDFNDFNLNGNFDDLSGSSAQPPAQSQLQSQQQQTQQQQQRQPIPISSNLVTAAGSIESPAPQQRMRTIMNSGLK